MTTRYLSAICMIAVFSEINCRPENHSQHNNVHLHQDQGSRYTANIGAIAEPSEYDYPDSSQAPQAKFVNRGQQTNKFNKVRPLIVPIQNIQKSTPVPILKQINRHNEDGSYTYGFEGADGSFKIETKSSDGEVFGKYGYVDDTGKLRTVEYGANKYGFRPSGEGITIPPPTLVNETDSRKESDGDDIQDDLRKPTPIFQAVQKRKQIPPRGPSGSYTPDQESKFHVNPHSYPAAQSYRTGIPFDGGVSPNIYREEAQPLSPVNSFHAAEKQRQVQRRPQNGYQTYEEDRSEENPIPQNIPQGSLMIPKIFESAESVESAAPEVVYSNGAFSNGLPLGGLRPKSSPAGKARFASNSQPGYSPSTNPPFQVQQSGRSSSGQLEGGSILEQLLKQYSLPPNGSPATHDLAYGFF